MSPLPDVKLRVMTQLPAGLRSGVGMAVDKSNGVYNLRLAFENVEQREAIAPDKYGSTRQLYWDASANDYVTVPYTLPNARVTSTSTTSADIATGTHIFQVDPLLGWTVGTRLRGTDSSNISNFIEGIITDYDYSTGTVQIDVGLAVGAGTVSAWSFGIASQPLSSGLFSYNNLSDVTDPTTARTNLGLGSAATQPSTAFAPSAITLSNVPDALLTEAKLNNSLKGKLVGFAANRTALAAMSGTTYQTVDLQEAGCKGLFQWQAGNVSGAVSADTRQALYVAPASDTTGASGAWARRVDGPLKFEWWRPNRNGLTDDTAILREAIVQSAGLGVRLEVPAGSYSISDTTLYSGAHVNFAPGSKLIQPDAGVVTAGNVIYGAGAINVASGVALTSDATNGDRNVVVASGAEAGFATGDYVIIQDDDYVFTPAIAGRNQEIMRVRGIGVGSINFSHKLTTGFLTSKNAKVYKLTPLLNAKITGQVEITVGLNRSYGIHLVYPVNCFVGDGVIVKQPRAGGGIVFETGYQSHIERAKVFDGQVLTSGLGYGVVFSESCTWCSVKDSQFENVRENTFTNRTRWCVFSGNTCSWIADTGWNTHGAGSDYNTCRNNTMRDCNQGVAVGWDGATRQDNNNTVENNLIYRCVNGISLSGAVGLTGGGNVAKGNTIKTCSGIGILALYQGSAAITGNVIHDSTTMTAGIQVINCPSRVSVTGNTVFDLSYASAAGIRADNSVNPVIVGNTVNNVKGGVGALGFYVPSGNTTPRICMNTVHDVTGVSIDSSYSSYEKYNNWN